MQKLLIYLHLSLIHISPILLILSIWIKIDSPGPILHIAKRIGKDKKEFYCYKFRTMVVNSDDILKEYLSRNLEAKREWETFAKLRGFDPRITKIGKWMRRFSLDELQMCIRDRSRRVIAEIRGIN